MPDPKNVPIQTRPTPVTADGLFWTEEDGPSCDNLRLPYGTPHPNSDQFQGFFLCKEERTSLDKARRWWAKEFELQDTYNDEATYSSGQIAYPIFKRRYAVLRSNYAPRASVSPLVGIVLVKVTAGGTGYISPPVVTAVGGTGAGAEFTALLNSDGEVAAVEITNAGTYSVAPTLTFTGGDGNGAAATPYIQPQNALLTVQSKVEFPADDPRHSIFVLHEIEYETLPGPLDEDIIGYEDETGAMMKRYKQRDLAASVVVPARGSEYPAASGFFVLDASFKSDESNIDVGTLIVEVMEIPDSREEVEDHNYPGPELFTLTYSPAGWPIPPVFPACPSGPYQNRSDHLDYTGTPLPVDALHRGTYELQGGTPLGPVTATYTYFITPPGAVPDAFTLTGQPGRQLHMIGRYTIHGALTLYFQDVATGITVVIENLRATNPDTYTHGSTVIGASQKQWKACFMRRIVRTVDFPVLPNE